MSKSAIIEGQSSLFEPESLHNTQVVRRFDGHDLPTTYGKPGSYMNTAQRAGYLFLALDAISKRNSRDGISLAAYTEPHSAPIWAHYQGNTMQVLDGASANRDRYQLQLRRNFWHATGFAAMRGQGIIREPQINPRAQKMWRDFNNLYGHPDNLEARNDYKDLLKRQIRPSH